MSLTAGAVGQQVGGSLIAIFASLIAASGAVLAAFISTRSRKRRDDEVTLPRADYEHLIREAERHRDN